MVNADFIILDHPSDLRIGVRGRDLKSLFENAAGALTRMIARFPEPDEVRRSSLTVSGTDLEDLLVRWLGEILYLFQGEERLCAGTQIESISNESVTAVVETFPFNPEHHEICHDIKAVTYHQIEIAERGDHWEARVILDV